MQKPQLVAVDTNVLMRLTEGHEVTIDSWELIKRRIRSVQFIALPTVLDELASHLSEDSHPAVRGTVERVLQEFRSRWRFQPVDFNAVQDAIAANASRRLRESGLVPHEERNDANIVAEAAVTNCVLLVSRDSHLTSIDLDRLALLFRQLDLPTPFIATPETLLRKFYPR